MAQYLDKAGLTTLWTKIKYTFALKSHTHKKSEITDLTIPTVNNPTITINQGGVKKGSFSLNQSGAATIDLTDDNTTYSTATQSSDGLMSASDKKKLEGIAEGANKITVDSSLSSTSTNPVQNKVIKGALDGKAASSHTHPIDKISGLQDALDGKQAKGDYYTINGVQARDDEFVRGDGNGGLVASGYTTSSFASSNHDHDNRYYTESEIDDKLGKKANISHSHSSLTNSSGRIFNVPTGGSGGEQKTLVITDDLNAYQPAGNYANASHDHTISDITGLYDELTGMTYVADSSDNSVQLETYGDGNSFNIPTKGYVDNALNGKSNLDHNHDSVYQAKGDYATNDALKNYVTGTTFIDYTTYIEGEVNKKANVSHSHEISNVSGLQSALDGKSGTGHTHTISNITNLQSTIDGIYTDMGLQDEAIAGKADSVHTHEISNINGLQSALDGKAASSHTHSYLPLSGGTMTGSLGLKEDKNILLRPNNSSYTSGIGYDTRGNECIALWAKNSVTRLRWNAGVDMSELTSGKMMDITPDFEISKADGTAKGYIAGQQIIHSGNIGSQNVNYANSAGSVNSVAWGNVSNKPFKGTSFVSGDSGNGEHNANNTIENGHYYYTSNGPATSLGASTSDGALYVQSYSSSWVGQIAQDYRNGSLFVRGKNNGSWSSWKRIIDSDNIGSQNVNYANSAGSANSVAWGNVSDKPSSFTPASHTHSYILDAVNSATTTFAYSKAGLNYNDYTWLAGWNGYELRAVNKSQFATADHTHTSLKSNTDNRNSNTTPNDYNGILNIAGLKGNDKIGLDTNVYGTYSCLIGVRGWSDSSGGNAHELAFTGNGHIAHRHGSTTSWSSWNRIAHVSDIPTKLPASNISMSSDGTTLTITYS